jgi:trehalose-phosphatase
MAAIPQETLSTLHELANMERLQIAILSGRSLEDLAARAPLRCILAGNHGLEIQAEGVSFVHRNAAVLRPAISCACADLAEAVRTVPGVIVEDKGLSATVHYRQAPADLREWVRATVQMVVRRYGQRIRVKPALLALELRPAVRWDKGSALKLLLQRVGGKRRSVVCAGDDVGDEAMFRAAPPDSVSIQVGGRSPTAARYHVSGPGELREFLETLRGIW